MVAIFTLAIDHDAMPFEAEIAKYRTEADFRPAIKTLERPADTLHVDLLNGRTEFRIALAVLR